MNVCNGKVTWPNWFLMLTSPSSLNDYHILWLNYDYQIFPVPVPVLIFCTTRKNENSREFSHSWCEPSPSPSPPSRSSPSSPSSSSSPMSCSFSGSLGQTSAWCSHHPHSHSFKNILNWRFSNKDSLKISIPRLRCR